MCVIILAQERPSMDILASCERANRDGIGLAWLEGGHAEYRKGLSLNELEALLDEVAPLFSVHFRLGSSGNKTEQLLTHPFEVTKASELKLSGKSQKLLMHNGHINEYDYKQNLAAAGIYDIPKDEPMSDSRAISMIAANNNERFLSYIPGKFVLIDSVAQNFMMYGDFTMEGENYYSNLYWKWGGKCQTVYMGHSFENEGWDPDAYQCSNTNTQKPNNNNNNNNNNNTNNKYNHSNISNIYSSTEVYSSTKEKLSKRERKRLQREAWKGFCEKTDLTVNGHHPAQLEDTNFSILTKFKYFKTKNNQSLRPEHQFILMVSNQNGGFLFNVYGDSLRDFSSTYRLDMISKGLCEEVTFQEGIKLIDEPYRCKIWRKLKSFSQSKGDNIKLLEDKIEENENEDKVKPAATTQEILGVYAI